MTPMARRIANADQHRLVLGLCTLERLNAPRIPINRVVSVLKQVRAGLVYKLISELFGRFH